MTESEKEFKNLVRDIRFDDTPDYNHREKLEQNLLAALSQQSQHKPQALKIWRIIMKNQITKLAAAIVVIVAIALLVTIFNSSTTIVWAIDQSIEAMSRYNAVVVEGLDTERTWKENGSLEQMPFKSWAVANEDHTMVKKYRHEINGVPILITNGEKTWRYDLQTNTVRVENRPYIASECWCGSQFLEQIKSFLGESIPWEVTYGKDPATGKQRAFLKIAWLDERYNGPRSMWIEFDVESKLPVSLKQWENANWEGPAALVVEKITYHEKLPDDLFEFEIPEGATVIEQK
jgi:outer membrane lipoprotein-sorting protein